LLLLETVVVKTAEPAQYAMNRILLHLPRHAGIFQPVQWHAVGQHLRVLLQLFQNLVHACPQRKDAAQGGASL